jgi:predicted secreted protein
MPQTGGAITAADSGRSFTLAPGDETSLRLSSGYVWSEPTVSSGAVVLSRVDYLQDPGFSEWLVRAASPGTATISSLGEPACAGQQGCPDEPLRFQVTITVAE